MIIIIKYNQYIVCILIMKKLNYVNTLSCLKKGNLLVLNNIYILKYVYNDYFKYCADKFVKLNKLKLYLIFDNDNDIYHYIKNTTFDNNVIIDTLHLIVCKYTKLYINDLRFLLLDVLILNSCKYILNLDNVYSIRVLGLLYVQRINLNNFANVIHLYVDNIHIVYGLHLLKKLNEIHNLCSVVDISRLKNQINKLNKYKNNYNIMKCLQQKKYNGYPYYDVKDTLLNYINPLLLK